MPSSRLHHVGVSMSDAHLVEVTAGLRHGVAVPTRWPAMLDGILATAERRARLGSLHGNIVDHHIGDLPLVVWTKGTKSRWVWAATAAQITDVATEDVRWWHKRFDSAAAERMVDRLPANTDVGPTKAWRMPRVVTVVGSLTWWALGDPARIEQLLSTVRQIGDGRATGEGVVTRWTVADHGDAYSGQPQVIADSAGHPARPWPARAADILGYQGCDTVQHNCRPPYWRAPQHVVDGRFARVMPEVIAPWATRCAA